MATQKITATMTTAKINSILKSGGDIEFAAGTYNLTDTLTIYSNTNIKCKKNVIFNRKHSGRMVRTYVASTTTKFNGVKNITWDGGTFVGNTNSNKANMITLFHATNVTFKNCVFKSWVALHGVEINACKNVTIDSCTFMDPVIEEDSKFREAIQIDFANFDGLAFYDAKSKCYDGTHCRSITINNCTFKNVMHAIGTHTITTEDKYQGTIDITNNTIVGLGTDAGTGVKLLNMRNVKIQNNNISNIKYGIYAYNKTEAHFIHGGRTELEAPKYNAKISCKKNTFKDVTHEFYIV